jgi:hypothetical protein
MSSWDAEGLALAVDEVRALCAMYDDGDDAATGADATSVDDPSVLLDLAESALSAAFPPPGASSSSVDPLAAVPALETTVRLLGARLRGGPVAVALTFPPGFPRVARLGAHVEGNARATLADLATLRAAAASAVEAVGLGEPGSAVSAVEAVRCAVEDARRSEDRRRDDAAGEEAAASPDASAPAAAAAEEEAGSRIARRLIWFHHIKAPSKRRDAKAWAKELALGGFVKPGYPGVILVEGRRDAADEYVDRLKRLRWKAMAVRVAEEEEGEEEGGEEGRSRRRLPETFRELAETGGLSELGEALREAGLERLMQAVLKQRTSTWTGGAG